MYDCKAVPSLVMLPEWIKTLRAQAHRAGWRDVISGSHTAIVVCGVTSPVVVYKRKVKELSGVCKQTPLRLSCVISHGCLLRLGLVKRNAFLPYFAPLKILFPNVEQF